MKNRGIFRFAAGVTLLWALVLPGCEQVAVSSRSFFENLVKEPPQDNSPAAPSLPQVSASDGLMTVSWSAVIGADSYEVYYSDTQTAPGTPAKTPVSTVAVINGLTNKTTYNVWVKAVNTLGVSALSPMAHGIPWPASEAPDTPGALTVIPGINRLTLNWAAVGGASSYDVYINTTPSSGSAGLSANVTGTTAVIGSLTNETIYYFWIKARNTNGASGFSPMEVGTPTAPTTAPTAPGAPAVSPGNKELAVSWAAVEMAMAYEVWVGTSDDSALASQHGGDVSEGELSAIITGLNNGTAYYVWIKAKNTIGASGFSPSATGTPSAFAAVPEEPGTPAITLGSAELTVQWTAVEGATTYEVWTGGTDNSVSAVQYGSDIAGTSITITGLSNGVTRYVWIKAKNSVGTSGFSPIASGAPSASAAVPVAPSVAPTVTAGSQQLSVSWAAVEGAAAYEVWAGTSNSSAAATKQGSDITNGLSAVIGSLTNGTTYYVWVKAKNSIGTSGFSPAASGTPNGPTAPPQAPGTPSLIVGNGQLTLNWAAVEGASAYEVWTGTTNSSGSATKYGGDITTGLSVTIGSLSNGTTYYVWVKAKNSIGVSGFSAGESGKPIADAGTPTVSSGNGQIAVSWASIAGADQYEVYCGTGDAPPATAVQTVSAPAVSTTIGSLTNGTTYHIWVKGKNTTGTGGISPMASGKPMANMGTVSVAPASEQLVLSWAAVAGADQYEVYHSTSTTPPASATQTVSAASATITGLSNGTMYYVWVKGKNTSGSSGISAMANSKPLATPGTPTVVAGNGELSVSWTAAAGADEYEVYYGIGTATTLAATVSGTSTTISGLANGTIYAVRIRAKNATGVSAYGAGTNGTPMSGVTAITLVSGTAQIALSWTAIAGADQYEVYYSTSNTIPATASFTVTGTSKTITGLSNGTTYYAWIKGGNAGGVTAASTAVSGKPLATPGTPTVVAGVAQLTVNWSAAVGADQYEVYYGIGTATTLAATVSGTSTTITGLANGTTYTVRVRGKNSTGVSGYSGSTSGKPLATPGTPTVSKGGAEVINVSWSSSLGADQYEVYYGIGTATILAATVSGTSTMITGLTNGTTYAVRIRGKNSTGVSGYSSNGSIYLGVVVTTLAGSGWGGSYADDTGTAAKFFSPRGVAVDNAGNVYVADTNNHRIRKISPGGVVTTLAGSGTSGYADGTGTAAQFYYPYGVAVDTTGTVYVADTNNHRIRKISPSGVVTTLAGSGAEGYVDGTGTAAKFSHPGGVAVDNAGNVYVADYLNRIRKISPGGVVTTFAGSGVSGYADGTGTAAQFNTPYGVAVDTTGNVYVADLSNYRIRKISPTGVVTTFAGSGVSGYADGTGTAAQFNYPREVAVDNAGNVYVPDSIRIRKISASGVVTTLAGSGTSGYADGTGNAAEFSGLSGVAVDTTGNVYVSDNHRIRKIEQ